MGNPRGFMRSSISIAKRVHARVQAVVSRSAAGSGADGYHALCRRCGQPGWDFFLSFTADILPQCAPTRFSASAACSWATWRRTAPTQRFATSATRAAILATIARTEASCVFVTNTRLHAQNSGGGSHSHDAHAQNHKQQIDVPAGLGLGGQDAHVKQRRQDEGHDGDGEAAECRQGARGEEKGY